MLEFIAHDPVLADCKLIAEAWDAGGLYQVGSFPAFGRWGEWNGKYRDCARRYLKGDEGMVGELAQRVQGSPDLYRHSGRSPATSVNFITCHDGFTLADLVSFNGKHNDANGEGNRDGGDDNHSWNCGAEGWSDEPSILALRKRQMMNAMAILLTSRGIPMILMGDEFGRSQHGNNNAYCLDSAISWVDWGLVESNADLHRVVKALIHFRKGHPALRVNNFDGIPNEHLPCCSFHGNQPWQPDWSDQSRQLAWMMAAREPNKPLSTDIVYVATNMAHYASWFTLPDPPPTYQWHLCFNTGDQNQPVHHDQPVFEDSGLLLGERSVVILTASKAP